MKLRFSLRRKSEPIAETRNPNHSKAGNFVLYVFITICAAFTALPLVYAVATSFKPLNELWTFPPTFLVVHHPTIVNYLDLFRLALDSWVPFSRYVFNSFFITAAGAAGHIVIASMCAFPLAKRNFPGGKAFFSIIVFSLMFNGAVTAVPNYLTMAKIGWIDTYAALIVPAIGSSLGLFLMKQFMEQIHDSILEAAKMDGASEWTIFWRIVMPQVKPAWLTIMIFSVQGLWNAGASNFIYSEELKTLPAALGQVISGGIARAGVGAAVSVVMMIVPMILFLITQSNIIQTMSGSGIKE